MKIEQQPVHPKTRKRSEELRDVLNALRDMEVGESVVVSYSYRAHMFCAGVLLDREFASQNESDDGHLIRIGRVK